MTTTLENLQEFIDFCQQHITGKERKEAQIFLDRFFRAFGHKGALEAGATYEEAITKGSKKGKTGFADLVWKEAYQEVGSKDAKIKEFYLGLFNSFTPGRMPLAGSCETTFQNNTLESLLTLFFL